MDNNLLPVGTIVTLVGKEGDYMITGKSLKIDGEFYHYSFLKYPEGYNKKATFLYLNDDAIEKVIHLGNINYRN